MGGNEDANTWQYSDEDFVGLLAASEAFDADVRKLLTKCETHQTRTHRLSTLQCGVRAWPKSTYFVGARAGRDCAGLVSAPF